MYASTLLTHPGPREGREPGRRALHLRDRRRRGHARRPRPERTRTRRSSEEQEEKKKKLRTSKYAGVSIHYY